MMRSQICKYIYWYISALRGGGGGQAEEQTALPRSDVNILLEYNKFSNDAIIFVNTVTNFGPRKFYILKFIEI